MSRSGRSMTGYETISPSLTIEGQALLADGSAAAPSLAFISDEKTGLYRNGSTLVASVGGTAVTTTLGSGFAVAGSMGCGTNALTCGPLAVTGTVSSSGSCSFGGTVSCPSMTTGAVTCGPLNTQGSTLSAGATAVAGTLSCGTNSMTCGALSSGSITASATVRVPDQSGTAPGLVFSSDTTSGFNREAVGTVSYFSSGAEVWRMGGSQLQAFLPIAAGTNSVNCGAVAASGTVSCGTNSMTCGALSSGAIAASGTLSCGTSALTCGALSCASASASGDVQYPRYRVSNVTTSTQTISASTDTIVNFSGTDTLTNWATRSDTTQFVAPVAGTYAVSAKIAYTALSGSGNVETYFTVNQSSPSPSTARFGYTATNASSGRRFIAPCSLLTLAANDVVRLFTYHQIGVSQSICDTSTWSASAITIDRLHE